MHHLTLYYHVERLRAALAGGRLHGASGVGGEVIDIQLQPSGGAPGVLRFDLRGDPLLLWGERRALPPAPPAAPSPLVTLLNKRLNGARLVDLWCCAADRIAVVWLERSRLSGRREEYALVAELFGRPPALSLVSADDEVVLATTHPRPLTDERTPPRLPGQLFRAAAPPPRHDCAVPFTVSPGRLFEAEWRLRGNRPDELSTALAAGEAWAYRKPGGRYAASPLRLTQAGLEAAGPFADLTAALLFCHAEVPEAPAIHGRGMARLRRALQRAQERLTRARTANQAAAADAAHADLWRLRGETLLCHLHELTAGREAVLPSAELPPELARVAADTPPSDQAQAAFHRYRRLRRTQGAAARRLATIDADLAYLADLRFALEEADDPATLTAVAGEIAAAGWLRAPQAPARPRGRTEPPAGILTFTVAGWPILVGRHARANDWLVRRKGRPDDFWLHAKDYPGAHVVVANPERAAMPPDEVVTAAAGLAAHFSAGRHAAHVALYFTRVRHLRRGPGMRPGQVLVDQYEEVAGAPQVGADLARISHQGS